MDQALLMDGVSGAAAARFAAMSGTAALAFLWLKKTSFQSQRKRRRPLPPGVPALPIVGSIPFLGLTGKDDHLYYTEMARKYGNVYSLWIANRLVVVLNGYDVIRKALVDDAITMAGRPFADMHYIKYMNPRVLGIIDPSYTPEWKKQRQLCLSILRDFGFGRDLMESRILNEVESLLAHARTVAASPFNPREMLAISVANVISAVLLGRRYPLDDCEPILKVIHTVDRILQLAGKMAVVDFFPVLAYLPAMKRTVEGIVECQTSINDFIKEAVAEHERAHHPGKEDDFIDAFMERVGAGYEAEKLQFIVRDLFMAGTETAATTLQWALLYMANHQDVQSRVQDELDREVGRDRLPTMEDKTRLPYTEAVIHEIQRCAALLPNGLPHMPLADAELCGYRIPKDTMVMINMWSVFRDPHLWPEPDVFRPERFLDDSGAFLHRPELIPFSLGRRSCLGEVMARQELFLFFCGLMQNFTIRAPEGVGKLDENGIASVTRVPRTFEIIAEPRD